jgi:hypothetical protein
MTLTELIAAVIVETNRPDLTAKTLQAIQSATIKAHQSDFFPRDVFESGIAFTSEEYEQDFEVKTFIPQFRALKYVRIYDNTNSVPGAFFDIIDPINALDSYKLARTNVAYLGGAELHFKALAKFQHMLFGCYLNPIVTETGYTSWIAVDHPFAIVYEAAAVIARSTGNTEKFASMRDLAKDEYRNLSVNNIQAIGY